MLIYMYRIKYYRRFTMSKLPVILDVETGIDDAMALVLATAFRIYMAMCVIEVNYSQLLGIC